MNSVFFSPANGGVQEYLGGVRSFSDGGRNWAQLLVSRKEQKIPVLGKFESGRNSGLWKPVFSHVSSDRVTRGNFATQLGRQQCCCCPSWGSPGVVGLATTRIKSRKRSRSIQSNRGLGFQGSVLVKECPCGAHPSPPASCPSSKLSRQQQFFSRTNTIFQVSSKLSERLAGEVDGSRFLVSENIRAWGDTYRAASGSLSLPPSRPRASFLRSAILSRSPDTKPEELHESDREAECKSSVATTSGESESVFPENTQPVMMHGGGGKSGFISFHRSSSDQQEPETKTVTSKSWRSIIWLLGPLVLTASVFLPPLYLRKIFGRVLNDSLMTDFVILTFTETLFFIGASVFLYIAHQFRSSIGSVSTGGQNPTMSLPFGYRVSSIVSLGIGLFLPVATFSMVWPWTGPAAAAALAPYMVGLLVQLCLEQIARVKRSPAWPLVPITFQMYRLHQLHRASQLISGLMFSLKGVEATVETLAISGSLQTLLFVLKILGVVCLGSLGAFLTHQLPTQPPTSSSISSLP